MKARKFSVLIIASLFAAAGSAALANDKWLGDRGDNWEEHVVSTKTRAQVIAELNEARTQGLLSRGDTDYPKSAAVKSSRTRDEVRAEAISATINPDRSIEYSGQ